MSQTFANEEDFSSWNEEMIEKYHPTNYHHSSNAIIRWIEGRRTKRILSSLALQETDTVLDLGCGAGDILEKVPTGILWGLDLSPRLVAEAQQRLGNRATIVVGNAEEAHTVLAGQTFDKIYCSEVLEHVQNPLALLKAIKALLKAGGTAVVSVPHESVINTCKNILDKLGILKLLFPSVARQMEDEWHLHMFTRKDLQQLCADAGLHVEKIYSVPFPFLPLRFVIKAH